MQPLHRDCSDASHSEALEVICDVWLHLFDNYGPSHHLLIPSRSNFVQLAFLAIFIIKDG